MICVCMYRERCMYIYIYIYIYRERERETLDTGSMVLVPLAPGELREELVRGALEALDLVQEVSRAESCAPCELSKDRTTQDRTLQDRTGHFRTGRCRAM